MYRVNEERRWGGRADVAAASRVAGDRANKKGHATPTSLVRPSFSPRRRSNNTIEMGPQSCLKTRTTNPVMVWRREGGEKRGRKGGWGGGRVMTKRGDSDDDDDTVMAAAAAAAATARK